MHVNVGLAWRFLPFLSLGANVGYATSSLAEGHSYGALAADVFAMAKFGGLKVTAGVANVGTTVKDAAGNEFCIPGSIAVGAGYSKVFGEKNGVDVLVDADYYFSGWMAVAAGAAFLLLVTDITGELTFLGEDKGAAADLILPLIITVICVCCCFAMKIIARRGSYNLNIII